MALEFIKRLLTPRRFLIGLTAMALTTLCGFQALDYWNARVTPEKVAAGKILFEHEWTIDDSLAPQGDGLGPVFNATSCVECHSQGGVGGSSGKDGNVLAFEVLPTKDRRAVVSSVIHAQATVAIAQESKESVLEIFPLVPISLRRVDPIIESYQASSGGSCGDAPAQPVDPDSLPRQIFPPAITPTTNKSPVIFHELNSPALFGAGLIDKISSASIAMHGAKRTASKFGQELQGQFAANSVGMTRMAKGGIGKFGWKGQSATLEDFVASACAMELGLSNPLQSQAIPNQYKEDRRAKRDMTRRQLNELVAFVRALPRPEQVMPEDPDARLRVEYGERLFENIGCADCHVKDLGGVSSIYTDFHLYNLEDLASPTSGYVTDEIEEEFRVPASHPEPDQWQTPALWGVADSAPYFHDGASSDLRQAILRHKGDADHSRVGFKRLSTSEQDTLIEFLQSLRAPQEATAPETSATSGSDGR